MPQRDIHVSVISHDDDEILNHLLGDLEALDIAERLQTTITINLPGQNSDNHAACSLPTEVVCNPCPRGFGANHNAAYHRAPLPDERKFFLIVNPDVRMVEDAIGPLVRAVESNPKIGVAAPCVKGVYGSLEDSAREIPTPLRLFLKVFGRKGQMNTDIDGACCLPDWVAGMFMLFRCEAFELLGGFDERYFLYYEDIDICCRVWLEGYCIHWDPNVSIVHAAQRKSRRNLRHMRWHIRSIIRFFCSDVYRRARSLHSMRFRDGAFLPRIESIKKNPLNGGR